MSPIRLLLVTPNAENNSLGRTYCLWLLARELGWTTQVVAVKGSHLWEPLRTGDFADDCRILTDRPAGERDDQLTALALQSDVIIAVKPLPTSFGVGLTLAERTGRRLLLDIDDLDIEVRTQWQPFRNRVKDRLSGRYRDLMRLKRLTAQVPVIVCNPVLQETYGGLIVPHVRPEAPAPTHRGGTDIVVRFVGSPRGHKGVDVLRAGVARFGGDGVRLEVTAAAPADARPWETWVGQTSIEAGHALVADADVIALPSLAKSWSLAQLPAKLMDAMMAGRAVVASDLPPIRWALGETGILVPPGDVDAMAAALQEVRDPDRRRELGLAAWTRARLMFGVPALAPAFNDYVRTAMDGTATGPASSSRPG